MDELDGLCRYELKTKYSAYFLKSKNVRHRTSQTSEPAARMKSELLIQLQTEFEGFMTIGMTNEPHVR